MVISLRLSSHNVHSLHPFNVVNPTSLKSFVIKTGAEREGKKKGKRKGKKEKKN